MGGSHSSDACLLYRQSFRATAGTHHQATSTVAQPQNLMKIRINKCDSSEEIVVVNRANLDLDDDTVDRIRKSLQNDYQKYLLNFQWFMNTKSLVVDNYKCDLPPTVLTPEGPSHVTGIVALHYSKRLDFDDAAD